MEGVFYLSVHLRTKGCFFTTACCSQAAAAILEHRAAVLWESHSSSRERNCIYWSLGLSLTWWAWVLPGRHAFPFFLLALCLRLQGIFLHLKASEWPLRLFALRWCFTKDSTKYIRLPVLHALLFRKSNSMAGLCLGSSKIDTSLRKANLQRQQNHSGDEFLLVLIECCRSMHESELPGLGLG